MTYSKERQFYDVKTQFNGANHERQLIINHKNEWYKRSIRQFNEKYKPIKFNKKYKPTNHLAKVILDHPVLLPE